MRNEFRKPRLIPITKAQTYYWISKAPFDYQISRALPISKFRKPRRLTTELLKPSPTNDFESSVQKNYF